MQHRLFTHCLALAAIAGSTLCGCESTSKTSGGGAVSAAGARPSSAELEKFLQIRTLAGVDLAPNGTLYGRDLVNGVYQLLKVTPEPAMKGSPSPDYSLKKATVKQLTNYKDGASGAAMSPNGRWILITNAVGGNENFQISILDTQTDAITPVTDNPKVQYAVNQWLDDSSGFIYSGNEESPNDFYIYKYDITSKTKSKLLGKEGSWSCQDATPDCSRVLVQKSNSASDEQIFELDTKTGNLRELTVRGSNATAANSVVGYLPGAESALIRSDHEAGMQRLYKMDLRTGSVSSAIPALDKFELDGGGMNTDKDLLAVVTNEDGYGVAHMYTVPDFKPVAMPNIERGVLGFGGFRGRTLVWSLSNARTPGLAYATSFPKPGAQAAAPVTTPLTFADTQGIDLSKFPLPHLVKYKSYDGRQIPAFIFFPPGYDASNPKPIPFACLYHGGPEGQSRPTFSAAQQYMLTRGIGIILPNVRGSSGYGREFLMMDDYKGRWGSVKDGVAAAKFLCDKGYSAPGRIATYGGSYGGYMSLACLVEDAMDAEKTGRKPFFGAGVDIVGIGNLKTFLEKTSGYRRKLREVEYGPLSDPDFLLSVSPLEKVQYIRVPMLIGHGANDPRVPLNEAIQLASELMKRGYDPEQIYFPDEGHGFAKLANRIVFYGRATAFLERTIGAK